MSGALARSLHSIKIMGSLGVLAALILAAGVYAAYQFVGPPPPDSIRMATGADGGAYQAFGRRYAEILARDGITVELIETAGSVENLLLLDSGDADIGFVQSGLAELFQTSSVNGLGTLYREPLWLFVRGDFAPADIGELAGKKLIVGESGSGTRAVAVELLAANSVLPENTEFLDLGGDDAEQALLRGDADAAFLVGAPEARNISNLADSEAVSLFDFRRSQAYARLFRFLSPIVLPEGVLDLDDDNPPQDIRMVAPGAMLAANTELHPALVDLLLIAATEIHGGNSLLADAGEFPTPRYMDLRLSAEAERHFEFGPPLLLRYLPFWAATLVDRLWILALPLIGLAIPLFKLLPPAYRWRIRRRLLRMYRELDSLDPMQATIADEKDRERRLEQLESIDQEIADLSVPRGYTDDQYKLRRDVDLIRRRLHSAMPASAVAE
jgi:TRAP transporter TAXI family solute receptor